MNSPRTNTGIQFIYTVIYIINMIQMHFRNPIILTYHTKKHQTRKILGHPGGKLLDAYSILT